MTITATFSNGHTDTYKGQRDVKAAWMITRISDGEVLASGHSLDRVRADKTANGTLSGLSYCVGSSPLLPTRAYPGWDKPLRQWGYDGPKSTTAMRRWAREKNAERLAEIRARTMIEIIDL